MIRLPKLKIKEDTGESAYIIAALIKILIVTEILQKSVYYQIHDTTQ